MEVALTAVVPSKGTGTIEEGLCSATRGHKESRRHWDNGTSWHCSAVDYSTTVKGKVSGTPTLLTTPPPGTTELDGNAALLTAPTLLTAPPLGGTGTQHRSLGY